MPNVKQETLNKILEDAGRGREATELLRRVLEWARTPAIDHAGSFIYLAEELIPEIAAFLEGGETAVSEETQP